MKDTWEILESAAALFAELDAMPLPERVETLNELRLLLHGHSPFAAEPVDCVVWVKQEQVAANDYNPNKVFSPELKLLEHSITADGYTQPIVTWKRDDGVNEVIDGFHRHRVGKESEIISARIQGYLPVVVANSDRHDKGDRMAATIRHNRARGKHQIEAMSDIVGELKKRCWSDEKIAKNLGMEPDEVLRLCQITGLAELFKDREFSEAWESQDFETEEPETISPVVDAEAVEESVT